MRQKSAYVINNQYPDVEDEQSQKDGDQIVKVEMLRYGIEQKKQGQASEKEKWGDQQTRSTHCLL